MGKDALGAAGRQVLPQHTCEAGTAASGSSAKGPAAPRSVEPHCVPGSLAAATPAPGLSVKTLELRAGRAASALGPPAHR